MTNIAQIPTLLDGNTYMFTVGPFLSAGDGLTPVSGLALTDFTAIKMIAGLGSSVQPLNGGDGDALDGALSLWTDLGNGYYQFAPYYYPETIYELGFIDPFGGFKGSAKLLAQASNILPYNEDFMVLHPNAYSELVNGPASSNTEITQILASVSGSSNLSVHVSAFQAQMQNVLADVIYPLVNTTNGNVSDLKYGIVPPIKVDTELILSKITKVGSISADIISGGVLKQSGTTIKDIEVRDSRVYVSYRDPLTGKMKVYDQLFTQDVVIASGGDLLT